MEGEQKWLPGLRPPRVTKDDKDLTNWSKSEQLEMMLSEVSEAIAIIDQEIYKYRKRLQKTTDNEEGKKLEERIVVLKDAVESMYKEQIELEKTIYEEGGVDEERTF